MKEQPVTDTKEDRLEECTHEACAVLTLTMSLDLRQNGTSMDVQSKELFTVHGEHSVQVFLDLLRKLQEEVYEQGEWVMETYDLPAEIVALAIQHPVEVVMVKGKKGKEGTNGE